MAARDEKGVPGSDVPLQRVSEELREGHGNRAGLTADGVPKEPLRAGRHGKKRFGI